jgi:predicted esterase
MALKGVAATLFFLCLTPFSFVQAADLSNSQAFVYDDGFGNTLPYRLFFPPGYDAPGAHFPLVLFLHGAGQIGNDNLSQVSSHIDGLIEVTRGPEHPAFLLAPQVQLGQGGWSRLYDPTYLAPAMDLTLQVIDQLEQTYAIDPTRRSVTGLSMGGFGTWDLIAKRPYMFTAAAPISGGGDPSLAEDLKKTAVWNFHGRNDNTVNVQLSRDVIGAIVRAGGDPIYLETLGSHSISDPIYDDPNGELYSWLIAGVDPPLATAIYNPSTGNLKIDARKAPGGTINDFSLNFRFPFDLQPTMVVDGVTVVTEDFISQLTSRSIEFDQNFSSSFGGIADFGKILPPDLSFEDLHLRLAAHQYSSPATGNTSRILRVIFEVPEPTSVALICIGIVSLVVFTHNRKNAKTGSRM